MLRAVIWHLFLEIGAKVKNFLRLSHLLWKHFVRKKTTPFLIVNPQSAKAAGGEPTANYFLKCINHKGNSILSYFYVEMKA